MVKTLDYILNRSDEQDIEVIAAAVIRRRRDIAYSIKMPMAPDPRRMAEEISSQFNIDGSIESMKKSVRDYAIRIIKQEAPELTEAQIEELTRAWIPGSPHEQVSGKQSQSSGLPREVLASMIDQFVAFSLGRMEEEEDRALRREMGPWPDKYWKAFPQVIRLLLTDYIKGEIEEKEFNTRLGLALSM